MPLFATTEQLRAHYPARLTFDIEDLLPTLAQVEQEYLAEQVLGQALYTALHDGFTSNTLSPPLSTLLERCRPAVANLAWYHFTGIANVEFTSGGLVVGQSDVKRPASEWRTRDLERAVLRLGYRALDALIEHLIGDPAAYPHYATSPPFMRLSTGFVRTTRQFDELVRIGSSGFLFHKLIPTIRRIEATTIQDVLCSTTVRDQLLASAALAAPAPGHAVLLDHLRQTVAHLAMADAIVELSLGIDERGVWAFNSLIGQTSGGPMTASDARLRDRITHHRTLGLASAERLQRALQQQATLDATHPYAASPCFIPPGQPAPEPFQTGRPVGGFL
jgi:hypothetical protein